LRALEEGCKELNYSLEKIESVLTNLTFPPELIAIIVRNTNVELTVVLEVLNGQKGALLQKVQAAIKEIQRKKTAAEAKNLERAKTLGRCVMNFEWIKCQGGYRCAGGSHTVTDQQVNFE